MSYYFDAMTKAVRDRLVGDATLRAVVASSSVRWVEQDADQALPFITLQLTSTDPDAEGFNLRGEMVDVDVHIYVESQRDDGSTPTVAGTTASTLDGRVKGDWDEQATGVPTYGIDRWTPSITSTGWTSTAFRWIGSQLQDDPGITHRIHTFRAFPNKAGVRTS